MITKVLINSLLGQSLIFLTGKEFELFTNEQKKAVENIKLFGADINYVAKDFPNLTYMELFIENSIKYLDVSNLKKLEQLTFRKLIEINTVIINPEQYKTLQIRFDVDSRHNINLLKKKALENYYGKYGK